MKITHVSFTDAGGGAARATYRLHDALRAQGVQSQILVRRKYSGDGDVLQTSHAVMSTMARIRPRIESRLMRLQAASDDVYRSGNLLPSRWAPVIDSLGSDLINIHWVGAGSLSIEDLSRIRTPIIMTLHDMWAFCGAEHYSDDGPAARWRTGYRADNRPNGHRGLDLDRWTWTRKQRHWRGMQVVAPSTWLASCVSGSALMRSWPVAVLPNALDTSVFRPHDREECRRQFGLPLDARVILFGAQSPVTDRKKGFSLLVEALRLLGDQVSDAVGVVFGGDEPKTPIETGIPLRWHGRISDDQELARLYSAADLMVVPSVQEAFGQTASESQSCGTPVVAFNATGLRDLVDHGVSGYLATPFSPHDLARGIIWALNDPARLEQLGRAARHRAQLLWEFSVVAKQYVALYETVLAESRK